MEVVLVRMIKKERYQKVINYIINYEFDWVNPYSDFSEFVDTLYKTKAFDTEARASRLLREMYRLGLLDRWWSYPYLNAGNAVRYTRSYNYGIKSNCQAILDSSEN